MRDTAFCLGASELVDVKIALLSSQVVCLQTDPHCADKCSSNPTVDHVSHDDVIKTIVVTGLQAETAYVCTALVQAWASISGCARCVNATTTSDGASGTHCARMRTRVS